ncbi:hypothetical protein HK099_003256 [Clydaea vesicula]|uniref:Uncharacterized protein n=1 Tax=Clydaea vesicula TaxID=447962 RepID=A0AAD5U1S9_9FUNG|nr:hypothetical protein HK099_003256 [Clydaea vesicula]KAJ3384041.1 hypothetical protein HDU92_003790 [Lobulomyces angularis]
MPYATRSSTTPGTTVDTKESLKRKTETKESLEHSPKKSKTSSPTKGSTPGSPGKRSFSPKKSAKSVNAKKHVVKQVQQVVAASVFAGKGQVNAKPSMLHKRIPVVQKKVEVTAQVGKVGVNNAIKALGKATTHVNKGTTNITKRVVNIRKVGGKVVVNTHKVQSDGDEKAMKKTLVNELHKFIGKNPSQVAKMVGLVQVKDQVHTEILKNALVKEIQHRKPKAGSEVVN